ncbi:MAG: aminopeptidase P family protein [Pseudomonadota bacterium]
MTASPFPARLAALRRALRLAPGQAFILPRAAAHHGETLTPQDERLAWLTGFDGSAGTALITARAAALAVDGRYTQQARQQAPAFEGIGATLSDQKVWLSKARVTSVLIDPWLHTKTWFEGATMHLPAVRLLARNPIDALWQDRPLTPTNPVRHHPLKYTGQNAQDKLSGIQTAIHKAGFDVFVFTSLESIAWLFNIRGNDTRYTPLVLATAAVPIRGKPRLYLHPASVTHSLRGFAKVCAVDDLGDDLKRWRGQGKTIAFDPEVTSLAQVRQAGRAARSMADPCLIPRAQKNRTELAGARAAGVLDGVAVTRLLAWLARLKTPPTEMAVSDKLESLRALCPDYRGPSFPSISATGPHSALPHYRARRAHDHHLKPRHLYLLDCGGQYPQGTTDATRTIAVGKAAITRSHRRWFTAVLKGHISLARAVVPAHANALALDTLARQHLWQAGGDYQHGTGHGVGSFLSVHESPPRINTRPGAPVKPGMIFSNEPGYYRPGAFGIRIENLYAVKPATRAGWVAFETLTFIPIDTRLVDRAALSIQEIRWIDAYHKKVRTVIRPRLTGPTRVQDRTWLEAATRPLDRLP